MNYDFVLDSYAWVEYFRGTRKGEKVKEIIESSQSCVTPIIVVAELSDKYFREKIPLFEKDMEFIISHSVILPINEEIAENAGRIKNVIREKHRNKFGLADALIYTTAKKVGAVVVTGDMHFKKLPDVLFLE